MFIISQISWPKNFNFVHLNAVGAYTYIKLALTTDFLNKQEKKSFLKCRSPTVKLKQIKALYCFCKFQVILEWAKTMYSLSYPLMLYIRYSIVCVTS